MSEKERFLEKSQEVAQLLKTLGHPCRLLLLCSLTKGEKTVGELEAEMPETGQSQISQYLKRMELEGLLESRRAGRNVLYRIADSRILELIDFLGKNFCEDE